MCFLSVRVKSVTSLKVSDWFCTWFWPVCGTEIGIWATFGFIMTTGLLLPSSVPVCSFKRLWQSTGFRVRPGLCCWVWHIWAPAVSGFGSCSLLSFLAGLFTMALCHTAFNLSGSPVPPHIARTWLLARSAVYFLPFTEVHRWTALENSISKD